ncbi:MAG: hypothetical protein U9R19_02435 [Bacteroidota bacterium]|nr:hypothetical protein [Bacteroidota bacterium]
MKKNAILLTIMMLLTSLGLQAQNEKNLIAQFDTADDILLVAESKTSSNFTVDLSKEKVDEMLEKAKSFGNYLTLSAKAIENKTDSYSMSLQFNHEAQIQEVHKMLMFFGFTGISISKNEFPLDHLLSIKK